MEKNTFVKTMHHLAELVVFDTLDFEGFLKKLIQLILQIVPVDSCFIYIYDPNQNEFVLMASKHPHKNQIGNIRLKKGEGITGWVAENKKVVSLNKKAYSDKRFKKFNEIPEDDYEAFLSVPISDKYRPVGVINLQNKQQYNFKKEQIEILEAFVKIVSSAFSQIMLQKRVDNLESALKERKLIEKAKGALMQNKNITEQEAFSFIRQEAMKKRKTKKEIAEAILLVFN